MTQFKKFLKTRPLVEKCIRSQGALVFFLHWWRSTSHFFRVFSWKFSRPHASYNASWLSQNFSRSTIVAARHYIHITSYSWQDTFRCFVFRVAISSKVERVAAGFLQKTWQEFPRSLYLLLLRGCFVAQLLLHLIYLNFWLATSIITTFARDKIKVCNVSHENNYEVSQLLWI